MAARGAEFGTRGARLLLVFVVLAGATNCGLSLRFRIDAFKGQHPDMVASVLASGLVDLIPAEDLGACGPNRELADLIPDCPLPGICFTAACTNHDLCYSTCGTDQAVCDETFFWDMVYLCDAGSSDWMTQTRCYSVAWIYYRAVNGYGEDFFWNTQAIVCQRESTPQSDANTVDGTPANASRECASTAPGAGSRVLITPPFVDADDDLMPDHWEIEMHLDPTDPHDARLDYDQDGRINLAEYIRGTDPYVAE